VRTSRRCRPTRQTMVATLKIPLEPRHAPDGLKSRAFGRSPSDWCAASCGGHRGARRRDLLGACPLPHPPPQLRDAHVVCQHSAQGTAGVDGAQQLDVSVYEGVCAGFGGSGIECSSRCRSWMWLSMLKGMR
jgi:hypothetical protein